MKNISDDRVELLKEFNISVMDNNISSDNLYLVRDYIYLPYNIMNFMMYSKEYLLRDILKRFRDREIDMVVAPVNVTEELNKLDAALIRSKERTRNKPKGKIIKMNIPDDPYQGRRNKSSGPFGVHHTGNIIHRDKVIKTGEMTKPWESEADKLKKKKDKIRNILIEKELIEKGQ